MIIHAELNKKTVDNIYMNKSQSEALNIYWVELSAPNGYRQFYDVLQKLNIPSKPFTDDLESALESIFATLFS